MFALCDGNSFYASCERVFRPDLRNTTICVLSNNDGNVVTRTIEAKKLGIKMGTPYFQIKHLVHQGKLVVFSSNYELYANLSMRMMQSLASLVSCMESYSIDEAFLLLDGIEDLHGMGHQIRERVMQWVGIPTCVGIGPTKTLAKFCNHLAKKYPKALNGVLVWRDLGPERQMKAMASEAVGEVWGIGRRISAKLAEQGIITVWDFYQADTSTLRRQFGVVVERTQRELHGFVCEDLHQQEENKQHIVRSRSFGQTVQDMDTLESAIAHHISSAAAKLREQGTQAHTVGVYINTNRFNDKEPQYFNHRYTTLSMASSDTRVLHQAALSVLKQIYRPGFKYKKCGIELSGIESASTGVQQDLWLQEPSEKSLVLMQALDQANAKFGRGTIKIGSELMSTDWHMNRDKLSPCFTTRFSDLRVV